MVPTSLTIPVNIALFRLAPACVLARAGRRGKMPRSRRFGNSCAPRATRRWPRRGKSLTCAAKAGEQGQMRQSMQGPRIATASFARALLLVAALAGCALPRSGPTARRDQARRQRPGARHARRRGHPADRRRLALGRDARLRLGLRERRRPLAGHHPARRHDLGGVWENVDTGLLAGVGQKATTLEAIQVDQSGDIFVPYAGRLQAAGRRPPTSSAGRSPRASPARPRTRRSRSAASPATARRSA